MMIGTEFPNKEKMEYWNRSHRRSIFPGVDFGGLLMGQMISCFVAGSGIAAASLSDRNLDFPLLTSFIVYLCLCVYLLRVKLPLNLPMWQYAFYAFLDNEANFFVVYSFRYTSITSIMLLDCFSIPTAMVLSKIFLGANYTQQHYAGVLLCLVGVITTVINDFYSGSIMEGHSIQGDFMALFGSFLYGCVNVMQESIVKKHDRSEFLGMTGMFGAVICGIQLLVFELFDVVNAPFTTTAVGYIVLYVVCIFSMYSWTSVFLQKGDSALFNLSLLTSDAYGVIFAYFVEKESFSSLYFLSFAIIMGGLFIYHGSHPATSMSKESVPGQLNTPEGSLRALQSNILEESFTPRSIAANEFRSRPHSDML